MKKIIEIELEEIDLDKEFGELYLIDDFIDAVDYNSVSSYDGIGYLAIFDKKANKTYESSVQVIFDDIWLKYSASTFNAVVWYNK